MSPVTPPITVFSMVSAVFEAAQERATSATAVKSWMALTV